MQCVCQFCGHPLDENDICTNIDNHPELEAAREAWWAERGYRKTSYGRQGELPGDIVFRSPYHEADYLAEKALRDAGLW